MSKRELLVAVVKATADSAGRYPSGYDVIVSRESENDFRDSWQRNNEDEVVTVDNSDDFVGLELESCAIFKFLMGMNITYSADGRLDDVLNAIVRQVYEREIELDKKMSSDTPK